VREHLHSRKQLALCDEVERASMLLWDLRSGVHRLDFAADTEQGEGRIKAAAMLRRRADALRARIKSLHRERGAMLRALDQGDAAHEHRQSELLRAVFAGRKPS
jgi:hypothetical protein